jgi:hypothetical protein
MEQVIDLLVSGSVIRLFDSRTCMVDSRTSIVALETVNIHVIWCGSGDSAFVWRSTAW